MNTLHKGTFEDLQNVVSALAKTENSYEYHGGYQLSTQHFSPAALAQLGQRTHFPGRFLWEFGHPHQELADEVVNTCVHDYFANDGKPMLFREFSGLVHGVLSSSYAVYDDKDVVSEAEKSAYLTNAKEVWYSADPELFHARFISQNTIRIPGDSSDLSIAVFITNSMTGHAALSVKFGIYRWACTNGMIVNLSQLGVLRRVHTGTGLQFQLKQAMHEMPKIEEFVISKIHSMAATASSISDKTDEEALGYLKDRGNVSGKTAQKILDMYRIYGGETKWDLANAITDISHEMIVSERLRLENLAAKIA